MKIKLVILFILGAAYTGWAQELPYFIEYALEHHPRLKATEAEYYSTESAEHEISRLEDPSISAGYNVLSEGMEDWNVGINQSFNWFGTTKAKRNESKLRTDQKEIELQKVAKEIEIEVSTRYYDLQRLDESIEIQQEIIENYKELEDLSTNNLSVSKGTMADVIRAQMGRENAEVELEKLRLERKGKAFSFNNVIRRNPTDTVEIQSVNYNRKSLLKKAETHPEIESLNLQIEESGFRDKVLHKASLPKLGLGVEYMKMKPNGQELMPILSVSLPIFRKKYKAQKETNAWQREALEYKKEALQTEIDSEREKLWSQLKKDEQEYGLIKRQLENASRAKDLLMGYYSTSGEDFREVLEIEREQAKYQLELARLKAELLSGAKALEYFNWTEN